MRAGPRWLQPRARGPLAAGVGAALARSGGATGRRSLRLRLGIGVALACSLAGCAAGDAWQVRCRHQDDPAGRRDFEIQVRGQDVRIRYTGGVVHEGERTASGVRFLEQEGLPGHPGDNDADDTAALLTEPGPAPHAGQASPPLGLIVNFDRRHDVVHIVSLERRSGRFHEHARRLDGSPGARIGGGLCQPSPAQSTLPTGS